MNATALPKWETPLKPAEYAENRLIDAILNGYFAVGSRLPSERELALQLGVTRPTLREALQRLGRDGWIEIRHGRQTRVRNYWQEGNLGVLGAIARHSEQLPEGFLTNLLLVRQLMAPAYIRLAVEKAPQEVSSALRVSEHLVDTPQAYARADWELHHRLTIASENPIFTLILNGFADFYQKMAQIYFRQPAARQHFQAFCLDLLEVSSRQDGEQAERITRRMLDDSLPLWQEALQNS